MKGNMSRREFSKRLGMVVGGVLVAVIGVPLLILPGSGMVLIFLGAGLVGEGFGIDVKGWLKGVVLRFSRKRAARVGGDAVSDGWCARYAVEPPANAGRASRGRVRRSVASTHPRASVRRRRGGDALG